MDPYRVIEVKQSVFADNNKDADALRRELKAQGTFLVNLMSSPGSGKTTTLKACCGILQFDSGEIYIDGLSIKDKPIECKSKLAYIPGNQNRHYGGRH